MHLPRLFLLTVATLVLSLTLAALLPVFADNVPETLRPPKGSQTALVVFEDLQCPQCGRVAPLLEQASRVYKIPLVQHDFPLPMHNWSFDAAVIARYFDTHSKELGNEFRLAVFEHQQEIVSPMIMRRFAEKFAADHKVSLPFAVEKDPKLIGLVNADKELGKSLNIDHTPTIWIVSSKHPDKPFVEVKDTTQLYVMIDAMK
ncbi:MAG TPA: thioredoxin domain-containing protein [Candidatus Saccharimonadales bacterium]|nr:thioredoxin domain-containing protein [Candidatus Saccharimonadales bacterium]